RRPVLNLVGCKSVLRRGCVDERRESKQTENDPQSSCHNFLLQTDLRSGFRGNSANRYTAMPRPLPASGVRRYAERRLRELCYVALTPLTHLLRKNYGTFS